MANHLTPSELAQVVGLDRSDVIAKCIEYGIPLYQGKIDKSLFLAATTQEQSSHEQSAAAA